MVDRGHADISLRRQCELLGVNRSGLYYQPLGESDENLRLMRLLDEQYTRAPFYGSRRMAAWLGTQGFEVNRKRVSRLIAVLGIEAVYPKPKLSQPGEGHRVYPYLLREVEVERVNQVWSTDITYIRMAEGFVYLVAVMDWFSRYVLSWELSNTMETGFCLAALHAAFRFGQPEIWNSDQGSQFTSADFLAPLKKRGISISMDGRGRALDNVFIERLWRSVKYEEVYLHSYRDGIEARARLTKYFCFYNRERLHQSLDDHTPDEVYFAMQSSLQQIIGQSRIIPLYSSVTGNGQNSQFTITGFAGCRVLDVQLSGSDKHLTIQPAPMMTRGGIPGTSNTSTQIYSPVVLVR